MGKASRGKRDRRFERKHPKPFKHMAIPEANAECKRPYSRHNLVRTLCKVCEMDVMLHCSDCEIQITGCLCTAVERMTPEDLHRFKEQVAQRRAREAGLRLPYEN